VDNSTGNCFIDTLCRRREGYFEAEFHGSRSSLQLPLVALSSQLVQRPTFLQQTMRHTNLLSNSILLAIVIGHS
jgi:hypothetical protein